VQFERGMISSTPYAAGETRDEELEQCFLGAWGLARSLDAVLEASHAYCLPPLLQVEGAEFGSRSSAWVNRADSIVRDLSSVQAEIDSRCFDLYSIDDSDRRAILQDTEARYENEDTESFDGDAEVAEVETQIDAASLVASLTSWAVGVAFGHFDVRLATGGRSLPKEPDPFDPLPVCSPGMLTDDDGFPLSTLPPEYPVVVPESGVLADDHGHGVDLVAAVRSVFDAVFEQGADVWWRDVASVLDPRSHDFRTWLRKDFFEYHLKLYSKSRRKAPIYWQLATPSAQYSTWLYAHRLTRDSFFQIQNDVVAPKLAHEERKLASLVQGAGGSPSANERKEIAAQESFVEELRAMLEEVKRVAPLWNPNLDDGVVLTMAPLWRLVPQHKSWQKELRSRWDELCAGKYDWAHVAMHLWPERVVPQCAKDRSLAIAHGLEDVFWVEGDDGKWTARSELTQPVDALVKERTSSAVKAALASLLDAPVPGPSGRGRRKGKRAASAKGNR
jgi:hypothetical protein